MSDPDEDLLVRVARGADGISPGPGASSAVRTAVAQRRRRRRTTLSVLGAVTATAVVALVLVVVPGLGAGGDRSTPDPADRGAVGGAVEGDLYRPAGFFEDVLGGRAVPTLTRYRATDGERFFTRLDWTPPGTTGTAYLAAVALESTEDDPARACASLVGGAATCERRDGGVLAAYDVPAAEAAFDPVHAVAPFGAAAADRTVRGVTFLREDGTAVSAVVCGCARDGRRLPGGVPADAADLARLVTDPSWADGPGGS